MKYLFILFALVTNLFATIINVPDEYTTIQEGIDASTDGDTVWVATGTYFENINFNGRNITVLGEDRETTIIDGSNPILSDFGSVVAFENNETYAAILDGLTLINGTGRFVAEGSPTNNIFRNGGGIYIKNSDPTIRNLSISNSTLYDFISEVSATYGGGIFCENASPTMSNLVISENTSHSGAGIYLDNSSPEIDFITVTNNVAGQGVTSGTGGGIYCINESNPNVSNSYIYNNQANVTGGIHSRNSAPSLNNVEIIYNQGGSININENSNAMLNECIVFGNNVFKVDARAIIHGRILIVVYCFWIGASKGS